MANARRLWLFATAAGVALILGAIFAGVLTQRSANERSANALLGLSLPDPAGKEQSLGQWRGKLVVVNFWATWCTPCREEMPLFVAAQSRYGARGLQFVGIAVDEALKVQRFVEEMHLNYPTLMGGYGALELSKTLGNSVMALPFTVVISRDGAVVRTQLGPLKAGELEDIIGQFL